MTSRTRFEHEHLIQHAFILGSSFRWYTFEACVSGGTSSQREVDVLATAVVEVVVHATVVELDDTEGVSSETA